MLRLQNHDRVSSNLLSCILIRVTQEAGSEWGEVLPRKMSKVHHLSGPIGRAKLKFSMPWSRVNIQVPSAVSRFDWAPVDDTNGVKYFPCSYRFNLILISKFYQVHRDVCPTVKNYLRVECPDRFSSQVSRWHAIISMCSMTRVSVTASTSKRPEDDCCHLTSLNHSLKSNILLDHRSSLPSRYDRSYSEMQYCGSSQYQCTTHPLCIASTRGGQLPELSSSNCSNMEFELIIWGYLTTAICHNLEPHNLSAGCTWNASRHTWWSLEVRGMERTDHDVHT